MHLRVALRGPYGGSVTRDTHDGVWVEPWGTPDEVLGDGGWALPGLVDAHAHLARAGMGLGPGDLQSARARAVSALEAGVGLVLDKGWRDQTVLDLIDQAPLSERPDIEAAGVLLAVEGGFWEGFARNVPPEGMRLAATHAVEAGRGWVKLIGDWPRKGIGPQPNFTESELAEAVAIAEAGQCRVAVHTMAREVPSMAVSAGVHSIEHGLFLTGDDLEGLGARGGSWVPTVLQVEAVIAQLGPDSSGGRLLREGLARIAANLHTAVECGVRVLTGSDLVISTEQVALEAIRLWDMGMPPRQVIEAASRSRLSDTASLFPLGGQADVVVFAEDLGLDPRVLAHPSRVVRLGRVIR